MDYAADPSQTVIPITSATKASPCVVTTTVPHGLTTGQIVLPSGNTLSAPSINASAAVTVIDAVTFSVAVDTSGSTGAGTGGSFVPCSMLNGAAGYQEVSAYAGFTGFVGKLRDSADNVTYADLIVFTDLGSTYAPSAQRPTVAGLVRRYVAYTGTKTGSGAISVLAGIARF